MSKIARSETSGARLYHLRWIDPALCVMHVGRHRLQAPPYAPQHSLKDVEAQGRGARTNLIQMIPRSEDESLPLSLGNILRSSLLSTLVRIYPSCGCGGIGFITPQGQTRKPSLTWMSGAASPLSSFSSVSFSSSVFFSVLCFSVFDSSFQSSSLGASLQVFFFFFFSFFSSVSSDEKVQSGVEGSEN